MLEYLQENVDITHLSNYKTPATAKYFFEIQDEKDIEKLTEILQFCRQEILPFLIVAGGTNMLFAFDEYPGVIVKNNLSGWTYDQKDKILESYSQESIRKIAESLETDYGQPLWHRFIGLPGSIGGAVFGNAGCFGLEIENNFLSAKVLELETGEIQELLKEDMEFEYRTSLLKNQEGRYFLISVRFDLSKKREKYHSDVDNIDFRENKQPAGNSCGSFFKNPQGIVITRNESDEVILDESKIASLRSQGQHMKNLSAGYLIEQVGLKGYSIGGAYFSEKHANFLMHNGQGAYRDMLELIQLAQQKVQRQFGVELINEVRIITPKI